MFILSGSHRPLKLEPEDELGHLVESLYLPDATGPKYLMQAADNSNARLSTTTGVSGLMSGDFTYEFMLISSLGPTGFRAITTQDASNTNGCYFYVSMGPADAVQTIIYDDLTGLAVNSVGYVQFGANFQDKPLHYAFCRQGTTYYAFVNGIKVMEVVSALGITPVGAAGVGIFSSGMTQEISTNSIGAIAWTRQCKYTNDFTPPVDDDFLNDGLDALRTFSFDHNAAPLVSREGVTFTGLATDFSVGTLDINVSDKTGLRYYRDSIGGHLRTSVLFGKSCYRIANSNYPKIFYQGREQVLSARHVPPAGNIYTIERKFLVTNANVNFVNVLAFINIISNSTGEQALFIIKPDGLYTNFGSSASVALVAYPTANVWHDLAAVIDHNTNTIRLYYDGTLVRTITDGSMPSITGAYYQIQGQMGGVGGTIESAPLYFADFRLTDTERYVGSYTPVATYPKRALTGSMDKTPANGRAHLLHLNGANNSKVYTNSGLGGVWTDPSTTAALSTTSPKFGTAAYLSNAGGYLANYSRYNEYGFADFTEEFFVKLINTTGTKLLLCLGSLETGSRANVGDIFIVAEGNKLQLRVFTSSSGSLGSLIYESTATLSTSVWTHVALTRQSGILRIFLGGTQFGSNLPHNKYIQSTLKQIGNGINIGRIDEYRAERGTAYYTSNFTPPTVEYT